MNAFLLPFPVTPSWDWTHSVLDQAFQGTFTIPEFELAATSVQTPGVHIRPLKQATGQLEKRLWDLGHAIKKADFARKVTTDELSRGTAGFFLEQSSLLDWSSNELRLGVGMANAYGDFSRTGLAGRIAQGMAVLFMEERGFAFLERFAPFLNRHKTTAAAQKIIRAKSVAAVKGGKKKRGSSPRAPDFVFEKHEKAAALVESKGGFVACGDSPDIKGQLSDALDQLSGWDGLLAKRKLKTFAIGTYLREREDLHEEPSLIAFVDPEGEEADTVMDPGPDAFRRANYASWLAGMGFHSAARRVLAGVQSDTELLTFPTLRLAGREFAFVVSRAWATDDPNDWIIAERRLDPEDFACRRAVSGDTSLHILGIQSRVLDALSELVQKGRTNQLMELEPVNIDKLVTGSSNQYFRGSVFLDGSLFGALRVRHGARFEVEVKEVRL